MNEPSAAELIALPDSVLTHQIVDLLRRVHTPSVFNHSLRTYLFARLISVRLGLANGRDYEDDLLFAACTMHDLGVAADGPHRQRFEVEGADRAIEFLSSRGVTGQDCDSVWQAIALHTSSGIAERRGALCVLVREGVAVDFGGPLGDKHLSSVTDEQATAIHAVYPRLNMIGSLIDEIVAQAEKDPANAPRYSVPGEFVRERKMFGHTRLERAVRSSSRWDS